MLKNSSVNLLAIITPHNTHAALALECLKSGRHVICEKPLALTTDECDTMIEEAQKQGCLLSTYHNRHWDGNVMFALEKVRSGIIGDVVRIEAHTGNWSQPKDSWRSSKSISGGILYNWGVHLLEYALQIIGNAEITEVSGFAKNGFWQTKWEEDSNEDEAFLVARFNTGQWITLCISSLDSNPKEGMFEITATKGSLIMGSSDWKMITHDSGGSIVTETGKCPDAQWLKYYQNISDHLCKSDPLVITPEWARRPIHIIELACLSVQKGTSLKAKYK
ncbi:MAG: Oxidoreductase domain protein [Candidatus Uhrbacteria bacterium GW2011_GWF2_39_13]|uniref:Oxidoreductase domain protein n=1 Tax=Candidatus Uhrbacteria bacterium GW2011_GWF2_39_13 TaxID=1618995 RepID=A0A0G0PYR2_9BACT|nr:MAG: Oxidoreductase domain protein [Candidatus Uhrbacteria bacterium GW2011_GWF2_39_13]